MKKMTFLAALLGVTHFANAQVGIGTPTPAEASMLHINADNKGVIIPNVKLQSTTDVATIVGTEVESLLVYNTATAGNVTPGFYYWVPEQTSPVVAAHWERIVNQTQLDEAIANITNVQADLAKVIALLKVAFPANNLVDPAVTGDTHGGGMVFTPGTTPTIEYVYFDGTNYVKKDITANIIDIIKGAESKTTIIQSPANSGKYYYISEETITANNGVVPTSPFSSGTTLRPGVVLLDVPQSVINNFQTILDGTTTIVKPGTTNEYYTVEEIIKMIASQVEGNVIYTEVGGDMVFQYWDGTQYQTINLTDLVGAAQSKTTIVTYGGNQYYLSEAYILAGGEMDPANWTGVPTGTILIDVVGGIINNFEEFVTNNPVTVDGNTYTTVEKYIQYISENAMQNGVTRIVIDATTSQASFETWNGTIWSPVANTAFETIVKANETETTIGKSTDNSAYVQLTVDPKAVDKIVYEYVTENETVKNYMDITADVEWSIINNEDVRNAITNVLNQGGNVYFTRTAIAAGTPAGQLAIPAFSFYTINATTGVKELVDIAQTIVNAITNATTAQKQEIKNQLGDKINNTTVVKTGDTFNGGDVYIYTNTTTIAANTAVTSGITIPTGTVPGTIIGIKVINANGISANVTDVVIAGQKISFNIGTGNVYNILGAGTYDVIVEFTE